MPTGVRLPRKRSAMQIIPVCTQMPARRLPSSIKADEKDFGEFLKKLCWKPALRKKVEALQRFPFSTARSLRRVILFIKQFRFRLTFSRLWYGLPTTTNSAQQLSN